MKPGGSSAP